MIEIYDEMSHIKDVLAHGFGDNTWRTDGKLLAMFYRDSGKKKAETLKLVKEKCERYCSAANGGSYNKTSSYKTVNAFVDKVYKKDSEGNYKEKIREIREVFITKEIVDWFLGLEDGFVISNERVEELKKRRPGCAIKNNRPMNFNRIKYLFTIYIWTLIKEQYLDKPNIVYLNANIDRKRFKDRANLSDEFNLSRERNLLFDLDFIDVNHGLGIIPKFKNLEIFKKSQGNLKKSLDNDGKYDIIRLSGEDLYNNGYWLLKQRNGIFVCQKCKKEFANYTVIKGKPGRLRKYCKECYKDVKAKAVKKRFCVDCGKDITPYMKKQAGQMIRCPTCQAEHLNQIKLKAQHLRRIEMKKEVRQN